MEHKNAKVDLSIEYLAALKSLKSHLCHNQETIIDVKPSNANFKYANESANEKFLPIDSLKSLNDSFINQTSLFLERIVTNASKRADVKFFRE